MKTIRLMGYMTYEKLIFIMQLAGLLSQHYRVLVHMDTDLTKTITQGNGHNTVEVRGFDLCTCLETQSTDAYDLVFTVQQNQPAEQSLTLVTQHYLDLKTIQAQISCSQPKTALQLIYLHWAVSRIKPRYVELLMEPDLQGQKIEERYMHEFDERDYAVVLEYMFEIRGALKGLTQAYKRALVAAMAMIVPGGEKEAKAVLQKGERVK